MAYKKIRKEQAAFLQQKEDEAKANDELIKDYEELRNLGQELLPHQEKRLKNLQKEQALTKGTVDLEKKLNKQSQNLNKKKQKSANLGKLQVANLKKSLKDGKINTAQFKSQVAVVEQIATGQASSQEIQEAINDLGEDATEEMKKYLKQAKLSAKANEMSKEFLSEADGILGGMGGKISGFLTNPLTLATAALVAFNAQQEAIGDEFGAIGVKEFRDDLAGASQEFTRMGLEGKEALTVTKELSSEFGIGFEQATAMADSVGNIAKSTGMGTAEATKLVGLFTELGGLSEQSAEELAKSAESLAVANGVAPGVILKDIAANTETFAKFSGAGAQGIARAAIQARKLGLELSDVASSMEGMLDFQSSLNAEVQASVMLGRNVNLQKARELALADDIEGFQKEILKQVGSQAEFDKMNVLQKKALADATGLSVDKLAKMVSKEKEAATLAGELDKQKITDMVPEETITKTAELITQFQAMGMQLAEGLGPVLNGIVGAFTMLVSGMEATVGAGPGLLGLYTALTIAKKKDTALTIKNAVAKFFLGAAKGSAKTMGFGTLVLTAIAAGAVATMLAAVGSAMVGDVVAEAGKSPVVSLPGQPNALIGRPDDDVLMAPGIASMANGGGGTTVVNNMDTSRMEKATAQTNDKLDQLITVMVDAPKKTGKAAAKGVLGGV